MPLPEGSMEVDPLTDSDEIARDCYEALFGTPTKKNTVGMST